MDEDTLFMRSVEARVLIEGADNLLLDMHCADT